MKVEENVERTFVMIKPEAIQRNITSQILKHFEPLELSIIGMKMMRPPQSLFDEHYIEFKNEYFFQAMVEGLVTRGPVIAICFLGNSAVKKVRTLLGLSHPLHSPLGSARGDLSIDIGRGGVHAADSITAAEREIKLWFKEGELF